MAEMTHQDALDELGLRQAKKAEEHEAKAREHEAEIADLEKDHSGETARPWREERARELKQSAAKCRTERDICIRRAKMAGDMYFPAGPDETGDHEFMRDHGDLYLKFVSREMTKSTGDSLRGLGGWRS